MYINSLSLIVTTKCNLACGYCFEVEKEFRSMPAAVGAAAVDWFFGDDVCGPSTDLDINFFGGEPLLNLELIKAVVARGKELARESGRRIVFSATTNGTRFSNAVADYWQAEELGLLLSCDGVAEVHDTFRRFPSGRGSFAAVEANLDRLLASSRAREVRMTVTPQTAPRVAEGVRWLKEKGFEHVAVFHVEEVAWDEVSILALQEQLFEVGEIYTEAIERGESFSVNPLDRAIRTLRGNAQHDHDSLCGAGRHFVAVGVDGGIYPCHRFATFSAAELRARYAIGHIDRGFDEMRRLPWLRIDRRSVLGCDIPCRECSLAGLCAGGCMAANTMVTGHLTLRPPATRLHEMAIVEVAKAIVDWFEENPSDEFERRFPKSHCAGHPARSAQEGNDGDQKTTQVEGRLRFDPGIEARGNGQDHVENGP